MPSVGETGARRVLLVTRNLPPLTGGMERLNWHMAAQLAERGSVRVIGPPGSRVMAPNDVAVEETGGGAMWRFLPSACLRALRTARAWRPDIVLAGSGLTAPLAWLAARLVGARCVVYVHGLDLTVRHAVYQALWIPVLRRMDGVIANSHASAELAVRAGVQRERIRVVHPGVVLPEEPADADLIARLRAQFGGDEGPILLSVGRWTRRKGLLECVDRILPRIVAAKPSARLVIVGDAPRDALHASAQSRDGILAAARSRGIADHVHFAGKLAENALQAMYAVADVHVFPLRPVADDPEGFGMVAIEAAARGLPTVAFALGGVVDAVAHERSGVLVASEDDEAFAAAVLHLLEQPLPRAAVREHAASFRWEHFGERLDQALAELCAPSA